VAVYASTSSRAHRQKGDQRPDVEREATVAMRTMRVSLLLLGNPMCRLHLSLPLDPWRLGLRVDLEVAAPIQSRKTTQGRREPVKQGGLQVDIANP
jgi:hypothetical protein